MSEKVFGIIYRTTNLVNGRMYIGKHQVSDKYDGTFDGYLGSGTLLKRSISLYGEEKFERETLRECFSKDELDEWEELYLQKYNCAENPLYYNCINTNYLGGRKSGYHHSEETKIKLSESAKRRGISKETRAKMMVTKSDPEYLKEFGKKISEAISGRKAINKNGIQKVVTIDDLPSYLDDGWELGVLPDIVESRIAPQRGKYRSPQSKESIEKRMAYIRGTIVLSKEGHNDKMVSKDDLQSYLDNGWKIGRSDSFKEMRRNKMLTNTMIHKGNEIITVNNEDLQSYLDNGWKVGNMTDEVRNKLRNKSEGRLWVQNGINAIKIYPDQLQEYLDKGYIRGQKLRSISK